MTKHTDMPTSECVWVQDNLELHAAHALSDADNDRFELHVLTCFECDRLSREFTGIMPLLGLAVPQMEPSSSVREAVLASARVDLVEPAPGRSEQPQRVTKRFGPPLHRMRLPHVLSAPVIGVLLLLGAITLGSQYQLGSQRDRLQQLEQENVGLSTHLNSIRQSQATYGQNATIYSLQGTDSNLTAAGILLGSPGQKTALVSVWNMPAHDRTYHVLCEDADGLLIAVGEFNVDTGGVGSIQVLLPKPISEYRAVHVVPGQITSVATFEVGEREVLHGDLIVPTLVPTD
jgi:Anti-sigma-K factor rskA